jgi:prepilin signal peptidase PulO-like enzyme (type II secretory pathway)
MAGFGALTGAHGILPALFLAAIAGAGTAVLYLATKRLQKKAIGQAIPYAPAIVIGGLLVMVSQLGAH